APTRSHARRRPDRSSSPPQYYSRDWARGRVTNRRMPTRMAAGAELAGYRIESVLGEGGAGIVYLAQPPAGAPCALKVMLTEAAGDPALRERLEREAQYLAAVPRPSVLTLYEAGRAPDGTAFLALEYVAGRDLAARLIRGVLDPESALFVLAQIA